MLLSELQQVRKKLIWDDKLKTFKNVFANFDLPKVVLSSIN